MMTKKLLLLAFLFISATLPAQKYSGQWSGSFDAKGSNERTEYFLELDIKGSAVEGTSTTYFIIDGKKCYTICKVEGTFDAKSKTIVSKEVARVKANTPVWFKDCFQIHTLTYFKQGDKETLEGTWKPTRKEDNCGSGTTSLSRKQLAKNLLTTPPPSNSNVRMNSTPPKPTNTKPQENKKPENPTAKNNTKPVAKPPVKKDTPKINPPVIAKVENKNDLQTKPDIRPNIPAPKLPNGLEKRDNKVYETIAIDAEEITVNLYDNAEIDGDIITVLFNGEVVASQKTLSDKPITLKLKAIKGRDNTLTMYAENQGRIPPNTAIMRVQNGEQYYKVFLSADDKKNGSVIFRFRS
ncbi:MAG: hypothetical protein QM725_03895 [Lacibacter sp.]